MSSLSVGGGNTAQTRLCLVPGESTLGRGKPGAVRTAVFLGSGGPRHDGAAHRINGSLQAGKLLTCSRAGVVEHFDHAGLTGCGDGDAGRVGGEASEPQHDGTPSAQATRNLKTQRPQLPR